MKKFVAFAVATMFTAGASIAMAQCPTCSGTAAPVFNSAQPVYSAPAAPVYSQPVYSAPAAQSYSQPVYSAPATSAAPVYSQPMVSSPAPVYSAPSTCGCGSTGGAAVLEGSMISGGSTYTGGEYTSYGDSSTLAVGSVINGETVVSVGESSIVETTDPGEGSATSEDSNVIDGSVEPSPDNGEVVSPPTEEDSTPAPEEATEGDA